MTPSATSRARATQCASARAARAQPASSARASAATPPRSGRTTTWLGGAWRSGLRRVHEARRASRTRPSNLAPDCRSARRCPRASW
eukprot:2856615-Alexandrium_andersonii.AAC.1